MVDGMDDAAQLELYSIDDWQPMQLYEMYDKKIRWKGVTLWKMAKSVILDEICIFEEQKLVFLTAKSFGA